MNLKNIVIAASAFVCAAALSPGWSQQSGVSLSINKAEAYHHTHLIVRPHYAVHAVYVHKDGLPWYAVRAYYWGGPWNWPGLGYPYSGWDDYAKYNGIGCRPGTSFVGADGIAYLCQ